MLKDSIKEYFNKNHKGEFKIRFLSDENNLYADCVVYKKNRLVRRIYYMRTNLYIDEKEE